MRIGIPIEIAVRELDAKIWLALNLIKDGHDVVLGRDGPHFYNVDLFEPDVMIMFGAFNHKKKRDLISMYQSSGISVIHLDSEGGLFKDNESYKNRVCPEPAQSVDWVYSWGPKPASIVSTCRSDTKTIKTTGHPTFDLLQKPLRNIYVKPSEDLVEKYGDYILYNTNFAHANRRTKNKKIINTDIENINNRTDWQAYLFGKFTESIPNILEEHDGLSVVIRPHPEENTTPYEQLFSEQKSVHVNKNLSVRPWIQGAKAVVHNGCTTGIEAALMDKPVIAYRPRNSEFEFSLANSVSKDAESVEELIALIELAQDPDKFWSSFEPEFELLKEYINNLEYYSAEKISALVSEMVESSYNGNYTPRYSRRIKRSIKSMIGDQKFGQIRRTNIRDGWKHTYDNFPPMSKSELQHRVQRFSDYIDTSNIQIDSIQKIENGFLLK